MKRKTRARKPGTASARARARARAPQSVRHGVSFVADAIRVRKQGGSVIVEAVPQRAAAPGGGGRGCKVRWFPGTDKPLCEGRCKVSSHWCRLKESRYGNWVHYSCQCGPPMDEPTPF